MSNSYHSYHIDPDSTHDIDLGTSGHVRIVNVSTQLIAVHVAIVAPPKPVLVPMVIEVMVEIDQLYSTRDRFESELAGAAREIAAHLGARVIGSSSHLLPTPTLEDPST